MALLLLSQSRHSKFTTLVHLDISRPRSTITILAPQSLSSSRQSLSHSALEQQDSMFKGLETEAQQTS
eukprot:1012883-Prymnesium_polylepis.1